MHGQIAGDLPADDQFSRLISIRLAQQALGGITRQEIYNRIAAGDLESVKLGRRRMITVPSLDAYVERLRAQARDVSPS